MMLIHKICMAFRGLGNFRNVDIVINDIAAMLLHMEKQKNHEKQTTQHNRVVCVVQYCCTVSLINLVLKLRQTQLDVRPVWETELKKRVRMSRNYSEKLGIQGFFCCIFASELLLRGQFSASV